jgi:predicted ribosome quality control (RQC) complex YloA/Tae2 family protein
VSNSLIYDPLLVRYLGRELDERLRGRGCAANLTFPGERRAVLALDGGEGVVFDLHPRRGWITVVPWEHTEELDARCEGVEAPPDERLLIVRLQLLDRFRPEQRALHLELHTNQWNALLVGEDGRILSLAWTRTAGGRNLRSGGPYQPPEPTKRYGAEEVEESAARSRWNEALAAVPPEARRAVLLYGFAYVGTPNADHLLGPAAASSAGDALEAAFQRWWEVRGLPPARLVLLRVGERTLPYPLPLGEGAVEEIDSLLGGMALLARAEEVGAAAEADSSVLARVSARRATVRRRIDRLEQELASATDADALRGRADLLLARLHEVPRGTALVQLEGWDGAPVEIELDPALQPTENAARMYDEARRRERGRVRVEQLLASSYEELERWDRAVTETAAGALPEWAERELSRPTAAESRKSDEPVLPYRSYRTSGGLEARVGKSARGNDDLTFRHAAPNDVWLHARSVPGSHVILRWRDPEAAPPARDLHEAAGLAAIFSRARSSGLVAVDWTRRKHVRKPRGAPPGAVIPQRVRTVFVEPDEGLPERLREE